MEQKIKDALEQIRPYLQRDGGDIEFVELTEDNTVLVRLQGHCAGCPGAHFFQQDVLFGTKTAANSLFNDMNFMLFHAHEARDLAA